jgi:hypothetical protein
VASFNGGRLGVKIDIIQWHDAPARTRRREQRQTMVLNFFSLLHAVHRSTCISTYRLFFLVWFSPYQVTMRFKVRLILDTEISKFSTDIVKQYPSNQLLIFLHFRKMTQLCMMNEERFQLSYLRNGLFRMPF